MNEKQLCCTTTNDNHWLTGSWPAMYAHVLSGAWKSVVVVAQQWITGSCMILYVSALSPEPVGQWLSLVDNYIIFRLLIWDLIWQTVVLHDLFYNLSFRVSVINNYAVWVLLIYSFLFGIHRKPSYFSIYFDFMITSQYV